MFFYTLQFCNSTFCLVLCICYWYILTCSYFLFLAIPASQGLSRRSSVNTPKPPPPVRRSSSISSQPPAVLQKYRTSPPRQLNPQNQPPPVSAKPTNAQNNQSNHRRSLSASGGTNTEHAYAELTEIQHSIQMRQQQQQQQGQYAAAHGYPGGYGPGAMSAPATPQYAQPVTTQNPIVNSNVVNSLNARFAAMNTQMVNSNQQSQCNSSKLSQPGGGVDMPELPPPPSEDELREMEQIYNVPKQNIQQTQAYNAQTPVPSNVQMRHPQAQPGNPMDMRQSLISEMTAGKKFRKMSNSEGGSEC